MAEVNNDELRRAGVAKMIAGGLMTINEVAAVLDVPESTVHKLDLPSIRLGRSLRFDPLDVSKLIGTKKEPSVPFEQRTYHMDAVFFGMKYHAESNGQLGYLVKSDYPMQRIEWSDVIDALCAGKTVTLMPAGEVAVAEAERMLEEIKANQTEEK